MCISNYMGSTRLLISNNDETIKVYSLPGLQRITSIQLPTAVNHAAVSPDGKMMVAVGDTNSVYLYDISPDGNYTRISTLTGTSDAGFSCAWNQTSDKFAVAAQDGFVCVWDIKNTGEKIAKFGSSQNAALKGACRCVKFSQSGSIDLMMYSEHVSHVNFVDARTFDQVQSVRVSPPGIDNHIAGVTFSPDSRTAFVGWFNFQFSKIFRLNIIQI
ncbi:hypothetical protein HK096_010935 [Nowakowskiella sp. JEL0078]|nr:hypothetical protein HK096_010935 [Nowakowskiella sp. JEL0078]